MFIILTYMWMSVSLISVCLMKNDYYNHIFNGKPCPLALNKILQNTIFTEVVFTIVTLTWIKLTGSWHCHILYVSCSSLLIHKCLRLKTLFGKFAAISVVNVIVMRGNTPECGHFSLSVKPFACVSKKNAYVARLTNNTINEILQVEMQTKASKFAKLTF